MTDQAWWAAGFALRSLVLGVGWSWLRPKNRSWQNVEEQWPGWTARFFYFVGLPYLAVISGVLSTRLLGLKGLEYFILIDVESVSESGRLVAEIQYASLLMLLEWFVDSNSMIVAGLVALLVLAGVTIGLARAGVVVAGGSHTTMTGVIYYGLHWAFYRAVFWLITDDIYLGIVWGAALVILEAIFAARVQGNWNDQQPQFLLNSIILILTAAVFFYSPNLWLLWLVQGAMVALVRLLGVADRGKMLNQANPA